MKVDIKRMIQRKYRLDAIQRKLLLREHNNDTMLKLIKISTAINILAKNIIEEVWSEVNTNDTQGWIQ